MEIHEKHAEWIGNRGVDAELAAKFGIFTHRDDRAHWLAIPYVENGKVVNHKYRMTADKRFMMDPGAPLTLWNHDVILDDAVQSGKQPLVITEGEMDALVAIQCGKVFTVSVPNGGVVPSGEGRDDPIDPATDKPGFAWFHRVAALKKVKKLIIATDGDPAGNGLAEEIARRAGAHRCSRVKYPEGCKDLNEVLLKHGHNAVVSCIDGAIPYPVHGLYRMSEIPDPGPIESLKTGFDPIDELFPVVPGSFLVMTGYPGHGKSQFLTFLMAKILKTQRFNIAAALFETMIKPIQRRYLHACLSGCGPYAVTEEDAAKWDALIDDRLLFFSHTAENDDDEFDLNRVLELTEAAIERDGTRLLIIDPWNELEHYRYRDESETEYIGRAIRQIKRFAKAKGIAIWVIAHPRGTPSGHKRIAPGLMDISGSSHWQNKPDYGVSFWRPDSQDTVIQVSTTKIRMGYPGKYGRADLRWDGRLSNYVALKSDGEGALV